MSKQNKTSKKALRHYKHVNSLSSNYSIAKRAPLNPTEIKRIQESIKRGHSSVTSK